MKGKGWKLLLAGGILAFLVLYGIEMASTGIERIYGPLEDGERPYAGQPYPTKPAEVNTPAPHYASETERRIAELERELAEIRKLAGGADASGGQSSGEEQPRLPGLPSDTSQPAVDMLADSTAGLLQSASSKSIRFVASLFNGLLE